MEEVLIGEIQCVNDLVTGVEGLLASVQKDKLIMNMTKMDMISYNTQGIILTKLDMILRDIIKMV